MKDVTPNHSARAEALAPGRAAASPEHLATLSPEATRAMLHEPQVHQIDPKLQNEELRRAPVAYVTVSKPGIILEANLTACTLLGVDRSALIGQPLFRFVFREDQDPCYLLHQRLFETGEPQARELRLAKLGSPPCWAELVAITAPDADGTPVGRMVLTDISERKQAEATLRESNKRLEDITSSLADWVWEVDEKGVYTYSSQQGFSYFGPSREDVIGKTPFDFMPPDEVKRVGVLFAEAMAQKAPIKDLENWNITKNGERVCLLTNGVAILDEAGSFKGYRGVDKDITARKQAEEALQENEARFRAMFEGHAAIKLIIDPATGQILDANSAAAAFYGWSVAELRRMQIQQINTMSPDAVQHSIDQVAGERKTRFEFSHRRADGSLRNVEVLSNKIVTRGQALLYSIVQDVTARKQADESLQRFFDLIPDLVCIASTDGYFRKVNPAWASTLGYTEDEILAKPFLDLIHPDDQAGTMKEVAEQLVGRKTMQFTNRYRCKDGTYRWLEWRATPAVDQTLLFAAARDITARKQTEESLQSALREKVALLNEVHHRVKNNLQVISSLLRLEAGRNAHPAAQSVLQEMGARIKAMALLHESLYRSGVFGVVDLGAYLRELSNAAFRAQVPQPGSIRLHQELESTLVGFDQAMPCGLLVNELLCNSLKHGFPGGGNGEVRIELQLVDGGPQVRLRVSNTGVGLPADFESKRDHSLGLQLVASLVRQLEGRLTVGPAPTVVFDVIFTPKPTPPKLASPSP